MATEEKRYLNRELSWLEFNQRVLDEAADGEVPPLEQLKFLAITSSNLDEFYKVRVGGLQQLAHSGVAKRDPSGMTPSEQLSAIRERVAEMTRDQYGLFDSLMKLLAESRLTRVDHNNANPDQSRVLERLFSNEIYGVYTPMAVVDEAPFPRPTGGTMNLCVKLSVDPNRPFRDRPTDEPNDPAEPPSTEPQTRYAIIPFGTAGSRVITVPSDGGYSFILLEDAVRMFVERFFAGTPVVEVVAFRVTLDADLSVREDAASDLLGEMRGVLEARKESHCVRLEIEDNASEELVEFLQAGLRVDSADVLKIPGPLDLSAFFPVAEQRGFGHLRYPDWTSHPSPAIDPTRSIFETIADGDVLLYHPYESFSPVVRFIEEAAADPDVLAIKQTLYRTSRNSPIVAALALAAEAGKAVTAIVELKARFDEERNIARAEDLERAGVQVVYGVRGLKTHAKVCVVVRREPAGIRRYLHFGTGNYNEKTARIYSDASLLTCNDDLAADAISFFNAITGYSQPQQFRKLEAAPLGLRDRVRELIEAETHRARQGLKARIRVKLNAVVDPELIDALYEASTAGVKVDLNVRGVCCLRPGIPGLSENIRVVSIIDRYLEHARILQFHHGGDELFYISSADWMPRNLDRRVELLVPVERRTHRKRLSRILDLYFKENVKSRRLLSNGEYERVKSEGDPIRSQAILNDQAVERMRETEQARRTVFEPYRAAEN
ncbi:polyphosphate kinase 1 [Stratiformator vulcanicus]|uniref:Polyphosphate kinase n=1 Tax=Stratiformator vulcanicus TaxID=2527980 RepID=A0A517QX62_9PLAN|nr:polyphosphate kinase 1 [Stratiformator vulcanicus]QDT36252.1 Polyphosphate kinase [Stratiformator vulcanicus]